MSVQEPMRISCATAEEARQAVERLLRRQVQPRDIEVISSEPIHEVESLLAGKSRLPIFVLTGAFLGIIAGGALASATALLYPLRTGGMPILSFLPIGIVTYEAMMLFAILFSLGGLLLEAKLLRRRPQDSSQAAEFAGNDEILVLARDRGDRAPIHSTRQP